MTYGYRRICALLNRKLDEMGKSAVNTSASIAPCARMDCWWLVTQANDRRLRTKAK